MKDYYNIHTHIFNGACAPAGFYGRPSSGLIKRLIFFPEVGKTLIPILKWINPFNAYDKGNMLAKLIRASTQESQEEVLGALLHHYRDFPEMKFVVLSLDFDFMEAGDSLVNFPTQLNELIALKAKYQERIIPFVCADPRRAQGKKLVDFVNGYLREKGFGGIKLYPALGYFPFDPALFELYEYAEKNEVPIISHCDRGGIFYQGKTTIQHYRPLHLWDLPQAIARRAELKMSEWEPDRTAYAKEKMSAFKNNFSDPKGYEEVLRLFPRLKLCFAHFGGVEEIQKTSWARSKVQFDHIINYDDYTRTLLQSDDKPPVGDKLQVEDTWFNRILKYLVNPEYSGVYTDISYTLHDDKAMKMVLAAMDNPKVRSRILFGTDYFLVQQEKNEGNLVRTLFTSLLEVDKSIKSGENTFDVIASVNPALFLKPETKDQAQTNPS